MNTILDRERDVYEGLWGLDLYRRFSPGEAFADLFVDMARTTMRGSVLDAGCGAGCLWAVGSFVDRAAQSGAIVAVNVHWTDLHVHRTWLLPPLDVHAGDPVSFAWPSDQPVFQIPGEATPLPPVTVGRAVAVSVPVGVTGARGN